MVGRSNHRTGDICVVLAKISWTTKAPRATIVVVVSCTGRADLFASRNILVCLCCPLCLAGYTQCLLASQCPNVELSIERSIKWRSLCSAMDRVVTIVAAGTVLDEGGWLEAASHLVVAKSVAVVDRQRGSSVQFCSWLARPGFATIEYIGAYDLAAIRLYPAGHV